MTLNAFEKIKKKEQEIRERVRENQKKRKSNGITLGKKRYKELQEKVEGWNSLFKDHRHPVFIDFINNIEKELMKDLRWVSGNVSDMQKKALISAKIEGQLELIEWLRDEPERIVKRFKGKKRVR